MNQILTLIYHIGNIYSLIISHKHKYIFIGLPFSASSAISKELIELYDGESIFAKHTNIQAAIKSKDIDVKEYFVFAVYRDPIEINKSIYSKYKNNSKDVYTDEKYLIQNGGHITKKAVKMYQRIQSENTSFKSFLKLKNKFFVPYDNVFSINEKHLNFTIEFNTLVEGFKQALSKIGIEQIRYLPVYNKTKNKLHIENVEKLDMFKPYYNRNKNIFKVLVSEKFTVFLRQIIYYLVHPVRKYKWVEMDKKRTRRKSP